MTTNRKATTVTSPGMCMASCSIALATASIALVWTVVARTRRRIPETKLDGSETQAMGKRQSSADKAQVVGASAAAVGVVLSALGLFAVSRQLAGSAETQSLTTFLAVSSSWTDHLASFLDEPELVPYFFEGQPNDLAGEDRLKLDVMTDVRLAAMDHVLVATQLDEWTEAEEAKWVVVFKEAFHSSPALCQRLFATQDAYDRLTPIAEGVCE